MAALWDIWRDADGQALRTVALVTTQANKTMQPVHDRMPAVLAPQAWDEWLGPGPLASGRLGALLVPAPEGLLECWAVGPKVNSTRNDCLELLEQLNGTST